MTVDGAVASAVVVAWAVVVGAWLVVDGVTIDVVTIDVVATDVGLGLSSESSRMLPNTTAATPPRTRKITAITVSSASEIGRFRGGRAGGSALSVVGAESALIPVRMMGTCDVIGSCRRPSRGVPQVRQKF